MEKEKEKLISIEELIARARNLGVNFGKGDPKNRLRYYVKLGILPHAKRKSFNGLPPNGAYPESALEILLEIDRKLAAGKSIQEIKREMEEEAMAKIPSPARFQPLYQIPESVPITSEKKPGYFSLLRKIFLSFIILIFLTGMIFFSLKKISQKNLFSLLFSALSQLVQRPTLSLPEEKGEEEKISPFFIEPYLTINAETTINAPLKVKEKISAPELILLKDELGGKISVASLTAEREYLLPDASGTICLTTGNCVGLGGEIFSETGTTNRLAKYLSGRRLGNSSIQDLYQAGVVLTISQTGNVGIGTSDPKAKLEVAGDFLTPNLFVSSKTGGNVGIGTKDPKYTLEVKGRIQASGDICTDLSGGKCLSQLTAQVPIFYGGWAAGIKGSGSSNYLPLWSGSDTLSNSLIYQSGSSIGIDLTNPNEKLTIAGAISLAETAEPSATTNYGKIYVGQDGKLYFKDESGRVYDLTTGGISGQGTAGQITFWGSETSLSGDDDFFWDMDNKKLGIGTKTPSEKLEVAGTIKMTGFQLTTGAGEGKVLVSDASGVGTWQSLPPGTMPPGTAGQTLRHDGSNWIANSFLYNDGSKIGIGTTSPTSVLTLAGDFSLTGPITLTSTSLPQFLFQYDQNNYFTISVDNTKSILTASKNLVINSLTGEIVTGDNTTLFNASGATVRGATFLSGDSDSTVRKSGEKVLRQAIPIFRFPVVAQTQSTDFVQVSRYFAESLETPPTSLPGAVRKYGILVNIADDIPTSSHSNWRIFRPNANQVYDTFDLSGQDQTSLEEGRPRLAFVSLPNDDWQLEVKVPAGKTIRIFNIMLLIYDEII